VNKKSRKLFLDSLRFGRPYTGALFLTALIHLLAGMTDLFFLYLLKQLADSLFSPHDSLMLRNAGLAVLFLFMLRSLLGYAGGYLRVYTDGRMSNDIQNRLYGAIGGLPMTYHIGDSAGNLMSLLFHHSQALPGLVTSLSGTLARELLRIPALVFFLFHLHRGMALTALLIFPPMLFCTRIFRRQIATITREKNDVLTDLYVMAEQVFSHMETVKIFGREEMETERFREMNRKHFSAHIENYKKAAVQGPVFRMLKLVCAALLVFWGSRLVGRNEISAGGMTAFLVAAYFFYGGLTALVSWYLSLISGLESAERVFRVLQGQPRPCPGPRPLFTSMIRAENLCFRYPFSEKDILRNLHVCIGKGENIAIAGLSGSGKSTFIRLLLRLYEPQSGIIRMDGRDIARTDLSAYKELFGPAPQDPGIFQETVAKAIAYGRPGASAAEMREACELAGIHDFISALPKGYNTAIGERGIRLSGGEKQRIALARALIRKPEILILDEALSSVDAPGEQAILKGIFRSSGLVPGQTRIVISHRLASVCHADRILVMDRGRIAEEGSHTELMKRASLYREWFRSSTGILE
jgi:ABC-type multidrug transport system fused ATPase/permease subunit